MKKKIKSRGKLIIVVGGQFGSEAKGLCVASLALERNPAYAVRTGSPNAGHTVYYNGIPYAMQTIPVAWVNSKTTLVLGAGSFIELTTLQREIEWIETATEDKIDPLRLLIDRNAYILTNEMMETEQKEKIHERMGSTGHGVGVAMKSRIDRDGKNLFRNCDYAIENNNHKFTIVDTSLILNNALEKGLDVLIEGTQGTMLDFYHGDWPYVTSRSTIAANWLAEVGLPMKNTEVVLVARTFPIRVAGNSGQLPCEKSWATLAYAINTRLAKFGKGCLVDTDLLIKWEYMEMQQIKAALVPQKSLITWTAEERAANSGFLSTIHKNMWNLLTTNEQSELKKLFEFTTVTKKLRRIADLDINSLKRAVDINGADWVWLNFLNYQFPEVWGQDVIPVESANEVKNYIKNLENRLQVPIKYVSTSPTHLIKLK